MSADPDRPSVDARDDDGGGWFAYTPSDLDGLSPEQRALAESAIADHERLPVLGRVEVVIYGFEPGQSEVRVASGDPPQDDARQQRVLDVAIAELQQAKIIFGGG